MKMYFARSRKSFEFMHLQVRIENLETTTAMEATHPCERFIGFYFELGLNYKNINMVLGSRHSYNTVGQKSI